MSGCGHCASGSSSEMSGSSEDANWMRMVVAALVAAQSMIFGLAVNLSPPSGMARSVIHGALLVSAVVVFLLVGMPLLREAIMAAREGRIVIEQLFLVGIGGAFFASLHSTLTHYGHVYYEVVAILLAIYTFGRLLGEQRRAAAMDAARALGQEFERAERLSSDGSIDVVPVSEIRRGDRVFVAGGAAIPVDGWVESGCAYVRESALTGESFPVVKRKGDIIRAGSFTVDQALVIQVESDGGERMLDRLLDLVRLAQERKSRLQREADRLVSWFLPIVLLVSVVTFVFWTWHSGWEAGVFNALAVLVVACPCSMGLATPIGIWGALSSLARRGLIARDSDVVEHLARVDVVVFDKTGTLGEERMEVVDFVCLEDGVPGGRQQLLEEIAIVESASSHPIAEAFRARSAECGVRGGSGVASQLDNFTVSENAEDHSQSHGIPTSLRTRLLPGIGIEGIVDGHQIAIGNGYLVADADAARVAQLRQNCSVHAEGLHEVFISRDGMPVGYAILRERLRDSSRVALQALKDKALECVVMTGDTARAAAVHEFERVHAEMTPEDKCIEVRMLRQAGRRVLFVGDGINDAPAMAEADVAIAVGSGTMLARETAQIELIGVDLTAISNGIEQCRCALSAIRHNLYFAAGYNVIGITLAACGVIHPVVAALLMLASSLTVTWQALRNAEGLGVRNAECELSRKSGRVGISLGEERMRDEEKAKRQNQNETKSECSVPQLTSAMKDRSLMRAFHDAATLRFSMGMQWALVVGLAIQGPLIAYLGNYPEWQRWGVIGLFFLVAAVFWVLLKRRSFSVQASMMLTMFSIGGVMMLIAWWAEAGFAAVVRGGVCLCGCKMSDLGWGLVAKPNWMCLGMVAASLPTWWMEKRAGVSGGWMCWFLGVIGMLIGMEGAMVLMAYVPVSNATLHFFASYTAMILGMAVGMLVACECFRKAKSGLQKSEEKRREME